MTQRLTLSIVLLSMVFGLSGFGGAESTVPPITNNAYEDSFPQIKDDYLVWQGRVGDDWEIFLYDIASGMTTQITDNSFHDTCPRTNGKQIVWKGFHDGESDIFLWHDGDIISISNRGAEDSSPQIYGSWVVFTSEPFGEGFFGPGEIILYNMRRGTSISVSAAVDPGNTRDDGSPRIDNKQVNWVQTDTGGNTRKYIYDLPRGPAYEVDEDDVGGDSNGPADDDEDDDRDDRRTRRTRSVLTCYDGSDRDVFVMTGKTGRYEPITDDNVNDTCVSMDGDYITWVAGEGKDAEICLFLYDGGRGRPGRDRDRPRRERRIRRR